MIRPRINARSLLENFAAKKPVDGSGILLVEINHESGDADESGNEKKNKDLECCRAGQRFRKGSTLNFDASEPGDSTFFLSLVQNYIGKSSFRHHGR